jgi:dihydrodipicolinate synthase/N-acetylneuraminate lyase
MQQFPGVHVALVTPRGKQGEVDFGAVFELLDHVCVPGISGVVLFGEDGEGPAFTIEERSRLAYLAVKRSRVPVLVGVGSPSLDWSVALGQQAFDAGVAGVLLPPPHFYRYDPGEIAEFCLHFVRQIRSPGPVLLYNTPSSASPLPVEAALRLLCGGPFAGIVDASGDPQAFSCLCTGGCEVLVAHDALFPDARRSGYGVVSSAACAVPELAVALDRAIASGDNVETQRLTGLWSEFLSWVARFPQPVIVKTATALRGRKTGGLPAPLSAEKQHLLDEFREWFAGWVPELKRLSVHA